MKMKIGHKEKKKSKTIKLPNKIRLAIVGIFAIILLFSVISLTNAYQKSTTTQVEVSKLEYNQVGNYNYIAYINERIWQSIVKDIEADGDGQYAIAAVYTQITMAIVYKWFGSGFC